MKDILSRELKIGDHIAVIANKSSTVAGTITRFTPKKVVISIKNSISMQRDPLSSKYFQTVNPVAKEVDHFFSHEVVLLEPVEVTDANTFINL